MRYLYQYTSSDNARHDCEIRASSRDDVFNQLKRQGIKAFNVRLAPGALNRVAAFFHGRVGVALIAGLTVAGVIGGAWWCGGRGGIATGQGTGQTGRRQILGDRQIIEDGLNSQWKEVLGRHGERWLAMYAQPGRVPRNGLHQVAPFEIYVVVKDFERSLDKPVELLRDDFPEYRQLADIVESMKDELRAKLNEGQTIEQYLEFLAQRQAEEYSVWTNALQRVRIIWDEGGDAKEAWIQENAKLLEQNLMALPSVDQFD